MWLLRFTALAVLGTFLLPLENTFGQDSLNVMRVGRYSVEEGEFIDFDHLVLYGDYALYSGFFNVGMMDVSNPHLPHPVASVSIYFGADIAIHSHYAYLAPWWSDGPMDDLGGFHILDLSDPTVLVEVGSITDPLYSFGTLAYANDYVYASDEWGGLVHIFDVSDPTAPLEVGAYQTPASRVDAMAAADSLLFAGTIGHGIRILSIANPVGLVEIAVALDSFLVWDLAISGNYLYAMTSDSFIIADIVNPYAPVAVGSLPVYNGRSVAIHGNLAMIADDDREVRVVDVSNPAAPVEVGFYDSPLRARDIAARDSLIYVAEDSMFSIYRFTPPLSAPRRNEDLVPQQIALSAYPNPFNSTSMFLMEVPPGTREITITVFDLLGREVQRELKPVTSAHMVFRFDASSLTSGVYFARVETPEVQRTTKLMLLK